MFGLIIEVVLVGVLILTACIIIKKLLRSDKKASIEEFIKQQEELEEALNLAKKVDADKIIENEKKLNELNNKLS